MPPCFFGMSSALQDKQDGLDFGRLSLTIIVVDGNVVLSLQKDFQTMSC